MALSNGARYGVAGLLTLAVAGGAIWIASSGSDDSPASTTQSQSLGEYAAPPGAVARELGEVGLGACWPEKTFAEANGAARASEWYKTAVGPSDDPDKPVRAANRDASWLESHKEYYDLDKVVPNWGQLGSNRERLAAYTAKLEVVQLPSQMVVQNTFCDKVTGQIVIWETQVFPAGEWIGFVPGHKPGTADPRPARKMVCGNWLGPVAKEETPPPATNGTPPPPGSTTTPPGGTTTPPPTTTPPNTPKIPGQAPDGGTGTDRQTAGPLAPPQVPKPTQPEPAQPPPPPPANPVPGGTPAPTTNPPLPVEPGGGDPSEPSDGCVPSPTDPC